MIYITVTRVAVKPAILESKAKSVNSPASDEQAVTLEGALAEAEQDAVAVLKIAAKVVGALKAMQKAAREGDLRKLRSAPEAIRQSMTTLDREITRVEAAWDFDEETYLRDGGYVAELIEQARAQRLQLVQQDDRLFCYPVLITITPSEKAVKIDRKLERKIRPSVLVGALRDRQLKQPRFKSAPFLESLRAAYQLAVERQTKQRHTGSVVPLKELYAMFTLMPGLSREYTLQELTRDIYLLDISGVTTTGDGAVIEFHASTGTKDERSALSIIARDGAEKRYFGISFRTGDS